MVKYNIHIAVICCDEERKAFQKRQFAALNLPHDVTYIAAYTPANSQAYIVDYDPEFPEKQGTLCCMRSHAGVLHWFYNNTKSDYVLIVEDDVTFVKADLAAKIEHAIDLFEKHQDAIDYVSLGYLIKNMDGKYSDAEFHDEELYWGKQVPSVWGTQAYLVKRPVVKQMIDIFYQPNTTELRKKIAETIAARGKYTNRHHRIQSDSLLAILFRQGFVRPILAIEMPFTSIIEQHNSSDARWKKAADTGLITFSDFFGCS